MGLDVFGEIEVRLGEEAAFKEEDWNEDAPEASVAIEEGMQELELRMNDS